MADAPPQVALRSDVVNKALGRVVKRRRESAGLTQSELATRLELTRASIANIERGDQGVSVQLMLRLARAVKVEARRLVADLQAELEVLSEEDAFGMTEELRRQGARDDREAQWIASTIRPSVKS